MFKGAWGVRNVRLWKWVLMCFLKEESEAFQLLYTSSKIIDPSQLSQVKGQRLGVILLFAQFSFAFMLKTNFSYFKIYFLLHFVSNHPETFRICSGVNLEKICRVYLWFRPLNWNYCILKILDLLSHWIMELLKIQNAIILV